MRALIRAVPALFESVILPDPYGLPLLYHNRAVQQCLDPPLFDNECGIVVRIGGKTTVLTDEFCLGFPITGVSVPALGTLLRSTVRRYLDSQLLFLESFVPDNLTTIPHLDLSMASLRPDLAAAPFFMYLPFSSCLGFALLIMFLTGRSSWTNTWASDSTMVWLILWAQSCRIFRSLV